MYYSPHSHLAIARARHEDMLQQAERARLARSFDDERPGVISRLRTHLTRKREVEPRPVTA
ncbi:MAG TPA: hypothetical protein VFG61_00855 [Gaiellaceae bacterium]|jgi:hypothetical protein|nr:hypothetical protein [Gaiellaceae bacterium]